VLVEVRMVGRRSGRLIRRRQGGRLSCAPLMEAAQQRTGGKLGCAVVRHS